MGLADGDEQKRGTADRRELGFRLAQDTLTALEDRTWARQYPPGRLPARARLTCAARPAQVVPEIIKHTARPRVAPRGEKIVQAAGRKRRTS
jgi:hypothetical protein